MRKKSGNFGSSTPSSPRTNFRKMLGLLSQPTSSQECGLFIATLQQDLCCCLNTLQNRARDSDSSVPRCAAKRCKKRMYPRNCTCLATSCWRSTRCVHLEGNLLRCAQSSHKIFLGCISSPHSSATLERRHGRLRARAPSKSRTPRKSGPPSLE